MRTANLVLLEKLRHQIEGMSQTPDFALVLKPGALREVTARQPIRHLGQPREGLPDVAFAVGPCDAENQCANDQQPQQMLRQRTRDR